jgi:hypothetical protein
MVLNIVIVLIKSVNDVEQFDCLFTLELCKYSSYIITRSLLIYFLNLVHSGCTEIDKS